MHADEVKQLVESQLEDCTVITAGEGCDFQITVVGNLFDGMSPVKRQQAVYACLNAQIASGAIHAVSIKALTPAQWQEQQG
ncbi:MAG TPA: BolA/IbaG family iron-sulfur metabolism protein [Marinobacterium sp.]|nr:BolA/IbaG family iron-sulfur metabolism protein [Marinobacterium sp.]